MYIRLNVNLTYPCQLKNLMFLLKRKAKKRRLSFKGHVVYMATQRYNLSAVRIDLNALDLQRREAKIFNDSQMYLYAADETSLHLWCEYAEKRY